MNINSPLIRKFITLGRLDNDKVRLEQDRCRSAAELIVRCSNMSQNELLTQCVELFRVPYFDLSQFDEQSIDKSLLKERLIRRHHVIPLAQKGNRLMLAVSDPTDYGALENYEFSTGMQCDVVLCDYQQIDKIIENLFDATHALKISEEDAKDLGQIHHEDDDHAADEHETRDDDAPIIVYINKILRDAIHREASDLHFEPYDGEYRIRFRIDGVLHEMAHPPFNLSNRLAARIKVMAKLDISEKRKPQDGRIKLSLSQHRKIDFRVSTLPTLWGEKIVMRVLDASDITLGIDTLGFEEQQKQLYLQALAQPYGMILATGPTGSGKTVSLYTGLSILNTAERNISTAEDPVEINVKGINQVQINPKAALTFANALRAFLRQDPDVVMVGEVRDLETAEIAIKASQTGHLVLSTLHTNSAPETITRLLNMGVPAYNVASSVTLVIAQRLARRLCKHCKEPEQLPVDELLNQGYSEKEIANLTLYKAVGCDECTEGYKGRIGLYELLPISPKISQAIMNGATSMEIKEIAIKDGFTTLRESGLHKAAAGITSLTEINRVTLM
ncbi:type IV-A pilus assembly ATPase PilB [Pseudoalteromonas sp. BDTF-M6]|uniref:type IV-A pilus assembly ATPase PilB n=1 Tax=Pseudoalteromonas sp. BDTF-M6 TaxID=2796132 RepID=UPI001BB08E3E|nr:type IV-A pilus assembly ATPase PilB [Pseudoalteromonas sp. BDTF-M6]MBS3797392.1 type IV-A pilus assembly ATPase PilB [Pseudoalteromonas sp. BDTF-M6]